MCFPAIHVLKNEDGQQHFAGQHKPKVPLTYIFPGLTYMSFISCPLEVPQFLSLTDNFFSECQNYQSLIAADRKMTYETYHGYCDNSITKGWYRFEGAAGTRLPTSCTPSGNRCGTHATSWLTNGHPSVADGRVSKQVCFSYGGNCCYAQTKNITVRNCGNYYVYELVPIGSCSYRYCGTD